MKKIFFLCISLITLVPVVNSQVTINSDGSQPDPSAMLEVKSTSRGLLPPRMTTVDRNAIPSPSAGLVIYNSDCSDLQFYNGAGWIPVDNNGILTIPGAIGGNPAPCSNELGVVYTIAGVTNATGYHWSVPTGASITAGQGTTSITVSYGLTAGVICVVAYNDCFRSAMSCLTVILNSNSTTGVTISASANPACPGANVTFTATPMNGGTFPTYEWKKNGMNIPGATTSQYTYIPNSNDQLVCMMTSNSPCVTTNPFTSNVITMMINPSHPVGITITAAFNPICQGQSANLTSTISNGGTSPLYQWRVNGSNIPGATSGSYSYSPQNNDLVSCRLTSNENCPSGNPATSNVITMITQNSFTVNHVAGAVAPVDKTVTYGLATNIPGEPSKCWITRNLGASQQATSVSDATEPSAGWYWEFNIKQGYKHDGTNRIPNTPWINNINENSDWVITNDPCNLELGGSWRIPFWTEWFNVYVNSGWNNGNWTGPWSSGLKLHAAGNLESGGLLWDRGVTGYFWSSTQSNSTWGYFLEFNIDVVLPMNGVKYYGNSIRCIKE